MRIEDQMFLPLQEFTSEEHQIQEREENSNRVVDIQEITGYKFRDPILLQQAFTHHSYEEGCSSFERFEYLGDAFLNLMIAKEHCSMYPDLDPGKLTRLRAANVDTEKLARAALKHELHKFLRHDIFLLATQIQGFRDAIIEYPLHSSGLVHAPKVLADIVESLVGAIYTDSNYSMDTTWKVTKNLLEPIITLSTLPVHPVTQLQEFCDKKKLRMEMRDSWRASGEIEFDIEGKYIGKAKYSPKRVVAKSRAALIAYNEILKNFQE